VVPSDLRCQSGIYILLLVMVGPYNDHTFYHNVHNNNNNNHNFVNTVFKGCRPDGELFENQIHKSNGLVITLLW